MRSSALSPQRRQRQQQQQPIGGSARAAAAAAAGPLLLLFLLGLALSHQAAAFVQQHHQHHSPLRRTTTILPRLPFGAGASSYAWPPAADNTPFSSRIYAAAPRQGGNSNGGKGGGGGGLGGLLTAVPRFIGRKMLDAQDSVYVRRALFLPPGNGTLPAAEAEAVVVVFPGIGMGPKAYAGVARALQEALAASYDIKAYVVVAKFFNNLGYLPQEPERRLNSILAELAARGVSPRAPLGVVGHSGGAFLAYDAALTRSQAFVHMGCTLNSKGGWVFLSWMGGWAWMDDTLV